MMDHGPAGWLGSFLSERNLKGAKRPPSSQLKASDPQGSEATVLERAEGERSQASASERPVELGLLVVTGCDTLLS